MLNHCCYTFVRLLLHCCYTAVTLLLHCCHTTVTLWLHCGYTFLTLQVAEWYAQHLGNRVKLFVLTDANPTVQRCVWCVVCGCVCVCVRVFTSYN
jgi:hypothetical protein